MHPTFSAILSHTLIDRRSGHRAAVLASFAEKQEADRLSEAVREQRLNQRLADLLNHARAHVPHFRTLLGRHDAINPDNAREVLTSLPVMTRRDIQSSPSDFGSDSSDPSIEDATGGSTGTPMRFRVDRCTQVARESSLYWSDSLAGWRYGDRIAMLWGSDKDVKSAMGRWKSSLRWIIENRRWFNAFDMGEAQMAEFHRHMIRFRPHLLVAYAGSLHLYACYLRSEIGGRKSERGRPTSDLGPLPSDYGPQPSALSPPPSVLPYPLTALIASAEVMTPSMREQIESVFPVRVFDRYGNREFGAIAAECEAHEGLHLNPSDMIVEIDSPDPFRVEGRILITYLHNRVMPFLRYDTGDVGRFLTDEPCACGCTGVRLAPVSGRASDTIRTGSGKLIHGEFFTHLLYQADEVREFQFVQETRNQYVLRVVVDHDLGQDRVNGLRHEIAEVLDPSDTIRIERVDRIPLLPSGKRKFTLSMVGEGGEGGMRGET